jgi:hypothetical protein
MKNLASGGQMATVDPVKIVSDAALIAHYGGEIAATILSLAILIMSITRLIQVLTTIKRPRL